MTPATADRLRRDRRILRRFGAGQTATYIADKLGVTRSVVHNVLYRRGIFSCRLDAIERAIEAIDAQLTAPEPISTRERQRALAEQREIARRQQVIVSALKRKHRISLRFERQAQA